MVGSARLELAYLAASGPRPDASTNFANFPKTWSVLQDSNLRPSASKADALPDCAKNGFSNVKEHFETCQVVPPDRIELSPDDYKSPARPSCYRGTVKTS